jgi:hypothetical protein
MDWWRGLSTFPTLVRRMFKAVVVPYRQRKLLLREPLKVYSGACRRRALEKSSPAAKAFTQDGHCSR